MILWILMDCIDFDATHRFLEILVDFLHLKDFEGFRRADAAGAAEISKGFK